jgi:molybdopterin molybdotransferase
LLASPGFTSIEIGSRVSAAIVTSGDELVPPGQKLMFGQIFESNGLMLSALAKRAGANVTLCANVRDEFKELCATLRKASKADLLIISGGVSVGEHDLVRRALLEIGATIDLWRVKIKPGKPFLFGKRKDCAIFGLPGNPVSSFVTFLILVRPALLKMMGAKDLDLPQSLARVGHEIAGDDLRPHYVRGRLQADRFVTIGRQESHALYGLTLANALLRVQPGQKIAAGSDVTVRLID